MKSRALFFIGILVLISAGACGQSYFGIYAGVNSGKFSGDAPRNFQYSGKQRLDAGISFDLRLKDDVFFSISPGYLVSGSRLQYPYENYEGIKEYKDSINIEMRSFTFPTAVKIISDNQKWQFLGGMEVTLPISLTADNSEESIDIKDEINIVGLNLLFGLGYRIPLNKSILVINMGYSQGLLNLANNLDVKDALLPRIRFTSFRLAASWLLPVGRSRNESVSPGN